MREAVALHHVRLPLLPREQLVLRLDVELRKEERADAWATVEGHGGVTRLGAKRRRRPRDTLWVGRKRKEHAAGGGGRSMEHMRERSMPRSMEHTRRAAGAVPWRGARGCGLPGEKGGEGYEGRRAAAAHGACERSCAS